MPLDGRVFMKKKTILSGVHGGSPRHGIGERSHWCLCSPGGVLPNTVLVEDTMLKRADIGLCWRVSRSINGFNFCTHLGGEYILGNWEK